LALRTRVYFEYVPSKANIADLPSRDAFAELAVQLRGIRRRSLPSDPLRVPDVSSWAAPLATWIERLDDGGRMRA
jgi:hypothetical protein